MSREKELQHQRRKRRLKVHLGLFLIVNGFFVGTWLMLQVNPEVPEADPRATEGFYPGWLMPAWGVALGLHWLYVSARRPHEQSLESRTGDQAGRVVRTVLFTDIVGSTERASRLGDRRWGESLDLHDRVARQIVRANRGDVVKQTGDSLLAIFETPHTAIGGARALRDELAETRGPYGIGSRNL